MTQHYPVLLEEVLQFFEPLTINMFVDATLGLGGHALALLEAHPEIQTYLGFDQDAEAQKIAKERLAAFEDRLVLANVNFEDITDVLDEQKLPTIDGAFFDLGVSSMQLDQADRGFSFSKGGPLDMRMNPNVKCSAEEVVNNWSEKELGRIFRDYGELRRWRVLARAIVQERPKKRITTTEQLTEILMPHASKKRKVHPMTLPFQALRIAVNCELEVMETTLPAVIERLSPGGRLGVISYHSLEDRIVKQLFRDTPSVKILTKKPVVPSDTEIRKNVRSRSAKMRFVEKL
jgi:16S rRNA (cytosine1402-N4)-methyltransferase